MTKYNRYQDYVIEDGKLIGEFETIKKYWSDTVEISDWGNIDNTDYNGGNRTFFMER